MAVTGLGDRVQGDWLGGEDATELYRILGCFGAASDLLTQLLP